MLAVMGLRPQVIWRLAAVLFLATVAPAVQAAEGRHLGVASCAASVCHGKLAAQQGRDVSLNEYRTWLIEDRHSQAYRGLDSPLGRSIAAKLGLASASTAKICLDCHADNVPASLRGPKFQVSDGVGCEACHGGSEKWIDGHSQASTSHKQNTDRGMTRSEDPATRAAVCLQCHLGTQDRFTTHKIMGAGHPRLRFELATFTANQPAHFTVDADYIKRKGKVDDVNLWVSGQLEGALRFVTLLQGNYFHADGLMPEFSFYDCYSCHHTVEKENLRWSAQRAGPGILPGTLRVQRQQLIMLQALAEVAGSPAAAGELATATAALAQASQRDVAQAKTAAGKLADWLRAHQVWETRKYSSAETAALRKALLRYGAADKASDFLTAEQVVLGVESLSYGIGDHDRHKAGLDSLYDAVKSNVTFNPGKFAEVCRSLQGQF
jgi:hypothetical protein